MNNKKLLKTLEEIKTHMNTYTVLRANSKFEEAFIDKLSSLVATIGPQKFDSITDENIKISIQDIWKRCFARHQGLSKRSVLKSITYKTRQVFIDYGFYLDCHSKIFGSIFFKLFASLNNRALASVIDKAHELGILEKIVGYNKNPADIFSHIELKLANYVEAMQAAQVNHKQIKPGVYSKCFQIASFAIEFCKLLEAKDIKINFSDRYPKLIKYVSEHPKFKRGMMKKTMKDNVTQKSSYEEEAIPEDVETVTNTETNSLSSSAAFLDTTGTNSAKRPPSSLGFETKSRTDSFATDIMSPDSNYDNFHLEPFATEQQFPPLLSLAMGDNVNALMSLEPVGFRLLSEQPRKPDSRDILSFQRSNSSIFDDDDFRTSSILWAPKEDLDREILDKNMNESFISERPLFFSPENTKKRPSKDTLEDAHDTKKPCLRN